MLLLFALITLLNLHLIQSESTKTSITVIYNSTTESYDVYNKFDDYNGDAYGYYYTNYNESGWNYLDVYMQQEVDSVSDHLSYSKAIGFLEGYATCEDIKVFWPNFYNGLFGDSNPGVQTIDFIKSNYKWMKANSILYQSTDDYWYSIAATLQQLEGLFEGYVSGCGSSNEITKPDESTYKTLDNPTIEHFLMINAWGDLYQITMKFLEPGFESRLRGNKNQNNKSLRLIERCSALIKLFPDLSDVLYGHNTWDSYESMSPRIIKHYSYPLIRSGYAESHYDIYFSSSPALLSSVDDWYTSASAYAQLGLMETTNSLYNLSLLDLVTYQSVLSYMRVIVSTQLATSGYNWAETFSRYHSGTYTNQWMVLDLKLFTPFSKPSSGFLTVFEEVPGTYHYDDQTDYLTKHGYWPSYNNPFYEDIFELAGYARLCEADRLYCHDTAPRAIIFDKYHREVIDVQSGEWMLSYNNYTNDFVSKHDSCNTIACRGDLESLDFRLGAYGALDGKIGTVTGTRRNPGESPVFYARFGATHNDDLQPFCWSNFADESSYSHQGHPDCFDYTWNVFPPQ